jgi:hypothetical protein
MHTDPTLAELIEFVQDLVLDDASQGTEIEFDLHIDPEPDEGTIIQPALLARGMNENCWFQFNGDVMGVYFKGPAWKAHFLLQRILRGHSGDSFGRDPQAERMAQAKHDLVMARIRREEAEADEEFYDTIIQLCDKEREIGYEAGLADAAAHRRNWRDYAPFKWLS